MKTFAVGTDDCRKEFRMCDCPPFIRRAYILGRLRHEKLSSKKPTSAEVQTKLITFVFAEDDNTGNADAWKTRLSTAMNLVELEAAQTSWAAAEAAEVEALKVDNDEMLSLRAMRKYLTGHLKMIPVDLHNACIALGELPSAGTAMLQYFKTLEAAAGDASKAFQPQCAKTHTKAALKETLKCFKRGGAKLSIQGNKKQLAERLANVIKTVIEQGQTTKEIEDELEQEAGEDMDDFASDANMRIQSPSMLIEVATLHGQVPEDAFVTAFQAESSLGHNLADELADDDDEGAADKDVRAESLALAGVPVNPDGVDYSCLAVDLAAATPALKDAISASKIADGVDLSATTFGITAERASQILKDSIDEQRMNFIAATTSDDGVREYQAKVAILDPTQFRAYEAIRQWAEEAAVAERLRAEISVDPVRMLLLGTAGSGKTVTVRCAVQAARLAFGSFDSVLMAAHTGDSFVLFYVLFHASRTWNERSVG